VNVVEIGASLHQIVLPLLAIFMATWIWILTAENRYVG
jgi:hypothetical protein